ncbi:MAG: hypothetical protein OXC10_09815 [Rhodospirillaceae bacterium]|nr:hypothetical protein [Rhodospirillaceae bacterium]
MRAPVDAGARPYRSADKDQIEGRPAFDVGECPPFAGADFGGGAQPLAEGRGEGAVMPGPVEAHGHAGIPLRTLQASRPGYAIPTLPPWTERPAQIGTRGKLPGRNRVIR